MREGVGIGCFSNQVLTPFLLPPKGELMIIWSLLGIGLLCVVSYIITARQMRHALAKYAVREDQPGAWFSRFPGHENAVREYLRIIDEAFLLGKRYQRKIAPDDDIMALYHACLGHTLADSMELEHFLISLRISFGYRYTPDLELHGKTFGAFFAEVMESIHHDERMSG